MINVAALTSGKNVPSARFRVRQHIEPLKRAGICVREYIPVVSKYTPVPFSSFFSGLSSIPVRAFWKWMKILPSIPGVMGSWAAQMTWLERGLDPGMFTLERFIKRPLVLDVDDAIWLTPPFGRTAAMRLGKLADVVLAGNRHIAEWFGRCAGDVRLVPTCVDTDRIKPRNFENGDPSPKRFAVGWTGTSSNFPALYQIEKGVAEFLRNHDAELVIVADEAPRFSELGPDRVRYVKWKPDREIDILTQMDVGLMPLPFDEWSLGKCSFKMLQYMAAGLPVVVSPVGMNVEILAMGDIGFPAVTPGDWHDALTTLYHDRTLGRKCGAEGRRIVEKHFSRKVVSRVLAAIFKEVS